MRHDTSGTVGSAFALGLVLVLCEPAPVRSASPEKADRELGDPTSEAFAPVGTPAQYSPDSALDLEHAAITVVPGLVGQEVVGVVEYRARLLDEGAREIVLHGVGLTVEAATIEGKPSALRVDDEAIHLELPTGERSHGQVLNIRLHWRARPQIGLYFFGPDSPQARREAIEDGDEPAKKKGVPERALAVQAWTQGEMHETRHWLPIWDYSNDRFTSSWTIAAPAGFAVIANGESLPALGLDALPAEVREFATSELGSDAKLWRFEQRLDHVSYLLTMIVGRFDRVAVDWRGKPVEYWMPAGHRDEAEVVFGRTPAMLDFYSDWIGVEYPWAKYAQTPVQEFTFGGMENVSATTMTDRILFPARLAGIENRDSLVAHELAHQWWGDLLTCREWAHAWLNEGFATYFGAMWHEHDEGADAFALERRGMALGYFAEAKRYQRAIVTHEYRDASMMFDRHTYPKGGWVLHMLRRELGDEPFRRSIHLYAERNAFGLVETTDLQRAVRDATGKNMDWFFDQWVYGPGHPRLHASWKWDAQSKLLAIDIEQLQAEPFDFLLDLEWPSGTSFTSQRIRVDKASAKIMIPAEQAPAYVLIDSGMHLLAEIEVDQDRGAWIAQLQGAPHAIDRIRAADRLARLPSSQTLAALAAVVESDAHHELRSAAAAALGRIGNAKAQALLVGQIERERERPDSDARVRRALLEAFALTKAAVDKPEFAVVDEMLRKDPIDHVRAAAATAMVRFDTGKFQRKAIASLRKALTQHSHHELVEEAAAKALGRIGGAKQLDWLLDLLERDRPTFLRIAAAEGLLELRKRAGVLEEGERAEVARRVADLAHDPNMRVRRAVVDDIAELGLPDARERLRAIVAADMDARVRTLAEDELRQL